MTAIENESFDDMLGGNFMKATLHGSFPKQEPLYPQAATELMAGRRPLSAAEAQIPPNLSHVIVGPATALEIRWTRP